MRKAHTLVHCLSVILLATLAGNGATQAQTLAVNPSIVKQTIRGFGGIALPEWMGSDLSDAQRTTAFGNDDGQLGLSILRIWVNPDSTQWSKAVPTAKAAIARGAIVFATPWYPPASMRTAAGTTTAKYTMNTASFAEYVKHLNNFVAWMKAQGVDLHAISIQNEPDYAEEWTWWSDDQVYQFTKNFASQINCRVITAESYQYRKALYDKILGDATALANIDILGTHTYGTKVADFAYPLFDQKGVPAGKERWMTEHYTESASDADVWPLALDVATDVHRSMVDGQFNAYVWWYIRRAYGPMKEDGTVSKRGMCLSHYAKFIRPGAMRVDASVASASGVSVSAYKKGDSVVVVAVNTSTSPVSMKATVTGFKTGKYAKFTTSATKSLAKDGSGTVTAGAFTAYADAQSVVTWTLVPDGAVSIAPSPQRTGPESYEIHDMTGARIGRVDASQASGLHAQVRSLAPRSGIYFARPLAGGPALRIEAVR
ncbi:MAG: glucuronoxylanase XynC [Fibrobacterota bacterium]